MSAGAVPEAVHRLWRRYREFLREEVAATLDEDEHVDAERRCLMAALRQGDPA